MTPVSPSSKTRELQGGGARGWLSQPRGSARATLQPQVSTCPPHPGTVPLAACSRGVVAGRRGHACERLQVRDVHSKRRASIRTSVLLSSLHPNNMPVVFIRAFVSCKGGCGKTTLMFNCACAYARRHPDHQVMMLDFSETGDISTLALGGFIGTAELGGKGKAMAEAYSSKGIATTDSMAAAAAASVAAPSKRGNWLFDRTSAQASEFKMEGKLVDLHAVNPALPSNLFISVTSRDTASNSAFDTPAKRLAVKQGLMQFFDSDAGNWVIFIDTDGDRAFTHRTKMGLMLARCLAVPTEVNDNDARRMEYFTEGMREMQEAGRDVPPIKPSTCSSQSM